MARGVHGLSLPTSRPVSRIEEALRAGTPALRTADVLVRSSTKVPTFCQTPGNPFAMKLETLAWTVLLVPLAAAGCIAGFTRRDRVLSARLSIGACAVAFAT